MPSFNKQYWAHWFGQEDCEVLPLSEGVFSVSSGQKVAINCDNKKCNLSNIQINILDRNGFIDEHIKLDREFLEMAGVVVIFCDSNKCRLKYDNARFIYRR